jgi:hypothetical protein
MDWVTPIDVCTWLIYGCPDDKCLLYPTASNCWYRIAKTKAVNRAGSTSGEEWGHWKCAACLERWRHTQGAPRRLLVLGTPKKPQGFVKYDLVTIGEIPQRVENKILLLKCANALNEFKGMPLTKESLLQMIQRFNDQTTAKFKAGIKEIVEVESAQVNGRLDYENHLYCEDTRLSLRGPGHRFYAIDLKKRREALNEIDLEELDAILNILASGLDMEANFKRDPGPAAKAERWAIYDSDVYKEALRLRRSML